MCVACNHTIHRKNHNFAWSRDFAPALRCQPGETIHFECLDAGDGHFKRGSTSADVATLDFGRVNVSRLMCRCAARCWTCFSNFRRKRASPISSSRALWLSPNA